MKSGFKIFQRLICIVLAVFAISVQLSKAQPIYTIDPDFQTGEVFNAQGWISVLHILPDGKIFVGGNYYNSQVNSIERLLPTGVWESNWGNVGMAKLRLAMKIVAQDDGFIYTTFGRKFMKFSLNGYGDFLWSDYNSQWPLNPYKVLSVADIYPLENGDLLFGGAIANDLQLPGEYRGVSRLHADGSNDTSMPVLNITPNGHSGIVRRIHRTVDGAFYISGRFSAINGHLTNHIARLNADLTLDTTFVSPLVYNSVGLYSGDIILVDSLSRIWYSGHEVKLQQNPSDTFQLVRLQPTGVVDSSFALGYMNGFEEDGYRFIPVLAYHAQELEIHPGNYLIYGSFKYLNDSEQPCITVVNNEGSIQTDFFQSQGAAASSTVWPPRVDVVKQNYDGSLLIGGRFSQFLGEERYSIVKLKAEM